MCEYVFFCWAFNVFEHYDDDGDDDEMCSVLCSTILSKLVRFSYLFFRCVRVCVCVWNVIKCLA